MSFQRINVISGWAIWLVATIVFLMTLEPTASFWDCGEFIASANGLEVGHPPGAPFWMLLARLCIAIGPEGAEAYSVNVLSALSSSFTILFLFWSVTHMAKKMVDRFSPEGGLTNTIAIVLAGAIGGLAYTFSDSFWFSAVEGEVYAMSSFFTAVVFWAILKWETLADNGGETRWLILIAYLMGLSIGVHLLNLLTIPAIAFVYYFKKYEVSRKGIITTGLISLGILGLIQVGIIQGLISTAAWFELLFVNDFGMGFNSGVIAYAILIIALITGLILYTRKRNWPALNTLVIGAMVCIIGYSSFTLIVVRSAANPPMDENNPENLFTLLSYLNREQYGDRPLLYGHQFNTPTAFENGTQYADGDPVYVKSYSVRKTKGKKALVRSFRWLYQAEAYLADHSGEGLEMVCEYIDSGENKRSKTNYDDNYMVFLPRMYSSQADHVQEYKEWSDYKGWNTTRGRAKTEEAEQQRAKMEQRYYMLNSVDLRTLNFSQDQIRQLEQERDALPKRLNRKYEELHPSQKENLRFFLNYQVGFMYLRYFMWNFAGKQNDVQGHGELNNGNWLSGINFIDQQRLGNRDELPESYTNNRGLNYFYYLPLLLGLIGLVFQLIKAPKDFTVVALLFLMTGAAIVVYLNQYPNQPRERDYAYVGSFYAFAIWIGMAVCALYYAAKKMTFAELGKVAVVSVGGTLLLAVIEMIAGQDHTLSYSVGYMSVLALAALGLLTMLGQRKVPDKALVIVIAVLTLPTPYVMASNGWDDHNRERRRTGVDFAKNYLDSLAPNAIIFTNGDNDTFPLWYVQEVEGYRTDVRVVNLSLLNTDWYIDQMKRKAYNSDPVPFTMEEYKYRQGTRDLVMLGDYNQYEASDPRAVRNSWIDQRFELGEALSLVENDDIRTPRGGRDFFMFPSYKFGMPIDSTRIMETNTVSLDQADQIVDAITWDIVDKNGEPKQYITKNHMMVLDMIYNNNWERPIYFAVTTGEDSYIGLQDYFQLEGLAYRLLPIYTPNDQNPNKIGGIAEDIMYDNLVNHFQFGGSDDITDGGVYMDENNRRMWTNLRLQAANLAEKCIAVNKEEMALTVQDFILEKSPEENVPYDNVIIPLVQNYYIMAIPDSLLPESIANNLSKAQRDSARTTGRTLANRLMEIHEDEMEYFMSLEPEFASKLASEFERQLRVDRQMVGFIEIYAPYDDNSAKLSARLNAMDSLFVKKMIEVDEFRRKKSKSSRF